MAKDISIEIGFSGGASTGASVPEDKLEAFVKALADGNADQRFFTVTSGDGGELIVDLASVVFLRTGARTRSIGFVHD